MEGQMSLEEWQKSVESKVKFSCAACICKKFPVLALLQVSVWRVLG